MSCTKKYEYRLRRIILLRHTWLHYPHLQLDTTFHNNSYLLCTLSTTVATTIFTNAIYNDPSHQPLLVISISESIAISTTSLSVLPAKLFVVLLALFPLHYLHTFQSTRWSTHEQSSSLFAQPIYPPTWPRTTVIYVWTADLTAHNRHSYLPTNLLTHNRHSCLHNQSTLRSIHTSLSAPR